MLSKRHESCNLGPKRERWGLEKTREIESDVLFYINDMNSVLAAQKLFIDNVARK
jgi:hypothetical protein